MFSSQPANVKILKVDMRHFSFIKLNFRDFQGFDVRLKAYQVIFSRKKST